VILQRQNSARWSCPRCGYEASNDDLTPDAFFRPWHVRGRPAVKAYVESLGTEAREWLLALYVDEQLNLLAVDTVSRGDVSSVHVNISHILYRGHVLNAAGFILVHNHPSGDPRPSKADIEVTVRIARTSRELDIPLLDHIVIAGDTMHSVGGW